MLKILQINVGMGRTSQGLTKQVAEEINADAIVISEPNRNEGEDNAWYPDSTGRAAVAVTDRIPVENPGQPERGFRWVKLSGIRLYSCYWPPHSSSSITEFADFIDRLEMSIRESELPVIVAGDFNAKSGHWGSKKEDARGVLLIDWMASLNLAVCNRGNNPTFVRGNSESHIDLTFASNSIVKSITNWRILEKESLSLHQYITFDIAVNSGEKHHRKSGPRWS